MNWVKTLFAAPKTVDNVFDKDNGLIVQAGSWIGNLSFTDQEQAEHHLKFADKITEFIGTTLSENTERSKTRRAIAILWIRVQLALILLTAVCIPWRPDIAKQYFELSTCNVMLWGTGSVIVFFFGGYIWGMNVKRK